ncbi:MAG: hypothetical protein U0807_09980 [Candidatus Binatia bacterium]
MTDVLTLLEAMGRKLAKALAVHDEVGVSVLGDLEKLEALVDELRPRLDVGRVRRIDERLRGLTVAAFELQNRRRLLACAVLTVNSLGADLAAASVLQPAGLRLVVSNPTIARPAPGARPGATWERGEKVVTLFPGRIYQEHVSLDVAAGLTVDAASVHAVGSGAAVSSGQAFATLVDTVAITDAVFVEITRMRTDQSSGPPAPPPPTTTR